MTDVGLIDRSSCAFESEIKQAPMGRVTFSDEATPKAYLRDALEEARKAGIEHLVSTVLAGSLDEANALIRHGFALVDAGVVFERAVVGGSHAATRNTRVRAAGADDCEAIVKVCGTIFQGSRYYRDPYFSQDEADELHRRWIRNLFDHRAQWMWIAESEGAPVGFSALRLHEEPRANEKSASIELIGVSSSFAGMGLGKELTQASIDWLAQHASRLTVKTQAANTRACRLYQSFGFALERSELTFARDLRITP